ncbi:MAG TPA: arginine--tRNA ligase, partial [Sutterellaceae bacterium]|nr:arginine--tRNA ligase [Sutterellaceae bacterium]
GAYVLDIAQDFLAKKPIHTFDGNVVESSGNPDDLENIRAYAVAYLREEQHKDLTALGVAFDNYYLESSLYSDGRVAKAVQAIRNAGKTYEKDGALWFKSTDYGDDKDRVMRKADGSYTYFVPDVAYHLAKFERGFNRALNIQGSDHHGTVARVRAGIQAASGDFGFNIPKTFPEYMLHKMLQVVKDGQPVKMSKRSGTYVTLSDLVNWVGKDAARLFMVNRRADAEFVFDVDLALSQSDENPVYYLQYAHARICSVFAQAQEKGIEVPSVEEMASEDLSSLTAPTELRLMSKLSDFPTALANGTEDLSPLALVTYLKELAADFHSFYNAERVLVDDEKLRNARLALLVATRQVLRNGLEILGVSAPERLSRADQPADSTK